MAQLDFPITTEYIEETLFKPRDEVSQCIVKCQVKHSALQDTLAGLKSKEEIGDVQEWLKNVRKISAKQYKQEFKIKKLTRAQNT